MNVAAALMIAPPAAASTAPDGAATNAEGVATDPVAALIAAMLAPATASGERAEAPLGDVQLGALAAAAAPTILGDATAPSLEAGSDDAGTVATDEDGTAEGALDAAVTSISGSDPHASTSTAAYLAAAVAVSGAAQAAGDHAASSGPTSSGPASAVAASASAESNAGAVAASNAAQSTGAATMDLDSLTASVDQSSNGAAEPAPHPDVGHVAPHHTAASTPSAAVAHGVASNEAVLAETGAVEPRPAGPDGPKDPRVDVVRTPTHVTASETMPLAAVSTHGSIVATDRISSTPPASHDVVVPDLDPNVARLGGLVRTMRHGELHSATMTLHPAELGEVRVALHSQGGNVTVHLTASHAEGAEALRNATPTLRRDLESVGLGLDRVEVGIGGADVGGRNGGRRDVPDEPDGPGESIRFRSVIPSGLRPPVPTPRSSATDGVDLDL